MCARAIWNKRARPHVEGSFVREARRAEITPPIHIVIVGVPADLADITRSREEVLGNIQWRREVCDSFVEGTSSNVSFGLIAEILSTNCVCDIHPSHELREGASLSNIEPGDVVVQSLDDLLEDVPLIPEPDSRGESPYRLYLLPVVLTYRRSAKRSEDLSL